MTTESLSGLRVLECCGWNGAFAGRLLADAGADVVRVVSPLVGDPLASEPPFFPGGESIQKNWYHLGKRLVELDEWGNDGPDQLRELLAGADLLIEDWTPGDEPLDADEIEAARPGLVRVSVTPYGRTGPWKGYMSSDIVANAMSGSASVTGSAETPPINGYGNQTVHTVGLYAAIVALAALRTKRITGTSQHVDLSSHEALISCTEQVLMQWFFPEGTWRSAVAPRQGSLHWTGVYEVYPDRDGTGVMVTAAQRLDEQIIPWLAERGMAGGLDDKDRYPDLIALIRDAPHVMEVLREFIAANEADEVFFEAQRRRLAWGPVWDVPKVLDSPQIGARGWLRERTVPGGATMPFPGRMYETGVEAEERPFPRLIAREAIGWDVRTTEAAEGGSATPAKPLAGVRVLDFTHVLAGPFGTRVLGDLGAEVIKIGTSTRSGAANNPAHPYYTMWNRNKKSVQIDMSREEGRALCRRIAAKSNVVTENFRAGVLARWGMDRAGLADENPGLSVVSMSGMGPTGPWKDFSTYAPTIHGLTGLTYLTNPPGEHLLGYGFSLADHLSGLAAALASLEGIEHARRTGEGLEIDMAQYQVGLYLMAPTYIDHLANGRAPEPVGNRDPFGGRAPQGIYRCAGEDRWIAISVGSDLQWEALCFAMRQTGLIDKERFATPEARLERHDEIDTVIAKWAATQDPYEALAQLQYQGVPAGVVQNAEDFAMRDEQLAARGFLSTTTSTVAGEYGIERFPARFNGEPIAEYDGVHDLGADTFEVMTGLLGMDDAEVAELVAAGVLS